MMLSRAVPSALSTSIINHQVRHFGAHQAQMFARAKALYKSQAERGRTTLKSRAHTPGPQAALQASQPKPIPIWRAPKKMDSKRAKWDKLAQFGSPRVLRVVPKEFLKWNLYGWIVILIELRVSELCNTRYIYKIWSELYSKTVESVIVILAIN